MTALAWIATTRSFHSERHATSKIRSAADLQTIGTLGFRGEALPSIASVSRFRLTTREPNAIAGTEIIVNGGKIDIVRDGGEAPGTQVEVRSLFTICQRVENFSVLKTRKAVTSSIRFTCRRSAILRLPSLCCETIGSSFNYRTTATLSDRIRDLYGSELLERLIRGKRECFRPKFKLADSLGKRA